MGTNRYILNPPTTIITTTLNIPQGYKQTCIDEIYKIGDKQGQQTNVKAIMSNWEVWKETSTFNLLLDNIVKTINNTLPPYKFNIIYTLIDAWCVVYKEGHSTTSHEHLPYNMSFVYYLKSDNHSSPLVFDDCNFEVKPHDDMLVIFPSYLMHSVPTHKGEDRVCIAGSLNMHLKE